MFATEFLLVSTTCSDLGALERIATQLLSERLAACAQTSGPLNSIYRWEERVETAEEWLLQIKTRASLWPEIVTAVSTAHPYQVPELIATPLTAISPKYATWLDESLRAPQQR